VALFLVLLGRLVILWLAIILSPFMVLPYVLPESIKGAMGEGAKLQEKFVQNVIAPIPIALVMSVGFILVKNFKTGVTLTTSLASPMVATSVLISGMSTFQDLIAAVAIVAFIWVGVFSAADKTIAGSLTNKLKGYVEGAGKFVGTAWKYAPIFPTTTGAGAGAKEEKISLATAMGLAQTFPQQLEAAESKKTRDLYERIAGSEGMRAAKDIRGTMSDKNSSRFRQFLANNQGEFDNPEVQKAIGEVLKKNPTWKNDLVAEAQLKTMVTDKDGKPIEKYEDLVKNLQQGNVKGMDRFMRESTYGITPEARKPETGKAAAPGAPTGINIGTEEAKKIMGGADAKTYAAALGADAQKRTDEAVNPPKGSKPEDKLKAAQDDLAKVNAMQGEALDFRTGLGRANSKQDVEKAIEDRRKALKDKYKMDDTAANTVIQSEIMNDPGTRQRVENFVPAPATGGDRTVAGVTLTPPPAPPEPPKAAAVTAGGPRNPPPPPPTPPVINPNGPQMGSTNGQLMTHNGGVWKGNNSGTWDQVPKPATLQEPTAVPPPIPGWRWVPNPAPTGQNPGDWVPAQ
jgi:hypothetical protein